MKNNKGFTLIELLAVIVILAIILAIAIPSVLGIIKNSKKEVWSTQKALILDAAKRYPLFNDAILPSEGQTVAVSLQNLIDANLIGESIKNSVTGVLIPLATDVVLISNVGINKYAYEYIDPDASTLNPPGAPTILTLIRNESLLTINWSAPTDIGGSPITGYKIEKKVDTGNWSVVVANTGNTNTTYIDTMSNMCLEHFYKIYAINTDGFGLPSNEGYYFVGVCPP